MNQKQQLLPRELLSEMESLAVRLAPELATAPVYCANAPADSLKADCLAYCPIGVPDFPLRDALIAEGKWQGPGTSVVFCEQLERDWALGIFLHELSHALPFKGVQVDVEPTPELRMLQRLNAEKQHDKKHIKEPWGHSHGADWIRICLHNHWRAWQIGYEVGAGNICYAGAGYGLSPHWRYLHAIGDEPARMASENFATITAEPYPNEFLELWRADVAAWYRSNPEFLKGKAA